MFEESLRMQQSLRGAGDHLGIAITLYKLGDSPSLYKVISRETPSRALSSSSIPSRCSARCMATVLIPASQSLCGNSGMSWPRLGMLQKQWDFYWNHQEYTASCTVTKPIRMWPMYCTRWEQQTSGQAISIKRSCFWKSRCRWRSPSLVTKSTPASDSPRGYWTKCARRRNA